VRIPKEFEAVLHKADDPLVVKWALRRLAAERKLGSPNADELERSWFNDLTVRRLLDMGDPDILTGLFHQLGPTIFAASTSLIAERWPTWEGTVACWSAPVIAKHDPTRAHQLFQALVQSAEALGDTNKVFGVFEAISLLPRQMGRQLSARLVEHVSSSGSDQIRDFFFSEVVGAAWKFELPCLVDVVTEALGSRVESTHFERHLSSIYRRLTEGQPYYEHVRDLRQEHTTQSFASLALLFQENAPLQEIDDLVRETGEAALERSQEMTHPCQPKMVHRDTRNPLETCSRKLTR